MKRLIPVLISAALLLTACGQTAESAATAASAPAVSAVETAETVSAPKTTPNADASGTVTDTTVEATLKARDGDTFPDKAALRDITNKEGDEEYTAGGEDTLQWQNHGTSITYEGKSDAALPVTTRVTYYLDGQEIAPAELAGKSGHVRIRFDYTNHTRETVTVDGQEYTVSVPFTAITALILDGDKFTNIEVDNGKIMDLDDQVAVIGTAMPGLADSLKLTEFEPLEDTEIPVYFEVSADVADFALDFTATVLTPSALDDVDLSDTADLDDLSDALDKLTDATDEIADGAGALADGILTFYDGFHEYADGVQALNEGAEALADGLTQLYDNGQVLLNGTNSLRDGLSTVSSAVNQMTTGTTDTSAAQAEMASQLQSTVATYAGNLVQDVLNNPDVVAILANVPEEQRPAAIVSLSNVLGTAAGTQMAGLAGDVAGTVSDAATKSISDGISQLQSGLDQLASGSSELARGTDTYMKAIGQASHGADALAEGSAQLDDASDALFGGLAELHDGATALKDGMQEFSDKASDRLGDDLGSGLQNVVRRLKAAQQAGKNYQTFSGLADGSTGNVKFIVETAEIR